MKKGLVAQAFLLFHRSPGSCVNRSRVPQCLRRHCGISASSAKAAPEDAAHPVSRWLPQRNAASWSPRCWQLAACGETCRGGLGVQL